MSLREWAEKKRWVALFDIDFYTIAKAFHPKSGRFQGYVLFTNPLPMYVRFYATIEGVAETLGYSPDEIKGHVYTEQECLAQLVG